MKKLTLALFSFALVLGAFAFRVNITNAYDSGCTAAGPFSTTTGQACSTVAPAECAPGDLFSLITGQPCSSAQISATPVTTSVTIPNQQFKFGARGSAVLTLQQMLVSAGFLSGKVDGIYGPITDEAYMRYQHTHPGITLSNQTLTITTSSQLPYATAGSGEQATYQAVLAVSGVNFPSGNGTYSLNWSVSSGALPNGLALTAGGTGGSGVDEAIVGTATVAGNYTFSLTATTATLSQTYPNISYGSATKQFTLNVLPIGTTGAIISSISPTFGVVGTQVTITGTGFAPGNNNTINGFDSAGDHLQVNAISNDTKTISFTIPSIVYDSQLNSHPIVAGIYEIAIGSSNGSINSSSNNVIFTVEKGDLPSQLTPQISSILPPGCTSTAGFSSVTGEACTDNRTSANVGDTVYLYGSNFSPSWNLAYAIPGGYFNVLPSTFISSSILSFVIPSSAGIGARILQIETGDSWSNSVNLNFVGTTINPQPIATPPTLSSVLPAGCTSTLGFSSVDGGPCTNSRTSANIGDTVYLAGSNFAPTNQVTTYSSTSGSLIMIPVNYISSTLVSFVVPSSVGSGQHAIQVMQSYISASNSVSLTVGIGTLTFPPTPIQPSTPVPPAAPLTLNSVTMTQNTDQYGIVISATDAAGASNINDMETVINLAGANAGQFRGSLAWYPTNPGYLEEQPCSGGGYSGIFPYDPFNENKYIHLVSCSISDSGNTRTLTNNVTFDRAFTTPVANNEISGYVGDASGNTIPWTEFDLNFPLPLTR